MRQLVINIVLAFTLATILVVTSALVATSNIVTNIFPPRPRLLSLLPSLATNLT